LSILFGKYRPDKKDTETESAEEEKHINQHDHRRFAPVCAEVITRKQKEGCGQKQNIRDNAAEKSVPVHAKFEFLKAVAHADAYLNHQWDKYHHAAIQGR